MNVLYSTALTTLLGAQTALGQHAHEPAAHDAAQEEHASATSERLHVPPDPPAHFMGEMSNERMIELMGMDDDASVLMLRLDEFEWSEAEGEDALGWEAQAWFGNDYYKLWFTSEGESVDGADESRNELLVDRIVSSWWSVQAGVRHDLSEGPSRTWAAFGVQGLAPQWLEVEATAYFGEQGRTALRLSGEYELLLTQRLILQPQIELNLYGKEDERNRSGSGLADTQFALRLRYEIRREFAPYVGVVWSQLHGGTAAFARRAGDEVSEARLVAGVRAWF